MPPLDPGGLVGSRQPAHLWVPPRLSTSQGEDCLELSASAGLFLDPWESDVLVDTMATRQGGRWAAFEVGLLAPRQNGKNAILEARQLGGLFLLDEVLLIHTAHEFKTTEEHFRRLLRRIQSTPDLERLVNRISTSHGAEGIELFPTPTIIFSAGEVKHGVEARRIRFLARSRTSARGFSADSLYYDEALVLSPDTVGASMPTMTAMHNPQLWYTSSEGRIDAFQLARVRRRGLRGCMCWRCVEDRKRPDADPRGGDNRLYWAEWSAALCTAECLAGCTKHDDPRDPRTWAKANPGLGDPPNGRITVEYLAGVLESMDDDQFAAAHLAFSEWPQEENRWAVISEPMWDAGARPDSPRPTGAICLAVEASEDGAHGCIAVAGYLTDGTVLGEIPLGDHRPGTGWIIPRLVELKAKYRGRIRAVVIDPNGPAAPLIPEAEQALRDIVKPTARDAAQAYGLFYVQVKDRQFVHLGQQQGNLRSAVANAAVRETGDGLHAWSRKTAKVDISPLVAVTWAAWAVNRYCRRSYDPLASVPM